MGDKEDQLRELRDARVRALAVAAVKSGAKPVAKKPKAIESSSVVERLAVNEDVAGSKPASRAKRGRPRIGEKRDQPWIAAGMSRTTWYRRQKEKAK